MIPNEGYLHTSVVMLFFSVKKKSALDKGQGKKRKLLGNSK